MPQQLKRVMISSTARDLPEHRDKVMHACTRLGMFYPEMMENLTATDANALAVSLKMVDGADIYVGVFAFRYGYVPDGETISVTEAEYDRAVERNIARLIFLMSDEHPVKPSDVETGEGAEKLKKLKERLKKERVVGFFSSADDLLAQVIQALVPYREPDLTAFHYVSDIPEPPEAFIAHPYTLLQTHRLVGRQAELNLLTDWVAKPGTDIYAAHIMNIVAIGGMGKSALTWKWFNEIAPQEMKPLAGGMWWSFYESDASFENFVTRALAYVTRRPLTEVEQIPAPDREAQLLAALNREPFLIVLDGLERLLIAYARMDAAHLSDDDYDRQTANYVANAIGLPASAAQSFTGEHRLRKTADPRAGAFLRKLSTVRAARILVSTRLYPADLQTVTGEALGSCVAKFLQGLSDDDGLDLWRAFGVSGSRESLLPLFNRVENHPLLIQSLASEVARYRHAPGDFDRWQHDHPDFDPFSLPLVQVKSHVLEFALSGLDDKARKALSTIAAFRMPASYDTLIALLVGEAKPCADERELDGVLAEMEDRGLVGWDKRANRYDLHPIVRGVVWSGLGGAARRGVYTNRLAHFEALPKIDDYHEVSRLEDLTSAIELYNTLIGLGRYDDASLVFYDRLHEATFYRLSASRQQGELVELLFPDGLDQLPRLSKPRNQAFTLHLLALAYKSTGQPGRATALYRRANIVDSEMKDDENLRVGLRNLSSALRLSGAPREAEAASRRSLILAPEHENRFGEGVGLHWLGLSLAARGMAEESASALQRALRVFVAQSLNQVEGAVNSALAQQALWFGAFADAHTFANRAWKLAHIENYEADFIRAARVQGAAALGLHDFAAAEERLHHALTRARQVNYVEEELPSLITLAELRREEGKPDEARELLNDVWDSAERGPYPLLHADAFNVLAQLERDAGNLDKAIAAATQAYRLAWCDGPPFAYHWGLVAAQKHLLDLGAPEPEMPPFDESKFEPMPEVEIDPDDEFHAGMNDTDD
jgi:tetratricopeptide (TPR) repeat protein